MGRKLKRYDEYFNKLENYLQACEIELVFGEVPSDGVFIPTRRKIEIDENLDDSTEIATILHETGHLMDDSLTNPKTMKKLDKAYKAFYEGTASEKQKEAVIKCEKNAWEYGRGIAKKLRIPLGIWFTAEEDEALKGYGEKAGTE